MCDGQRDHGVRVREVEPYAFRGQAIERRRRRAAAVTAKRIRAQRVDGDQKNVLVGDRVEIGLPARYVGTRRSRERRR